MSDINSSYHTCRKGQAECPQYKQKIAYRIDTGGRSPYDWHGWHIDIDDCYPTVCYCPYCGIKLEVPEPKQVID